MTRNTFNNFFSLLVSAFLINSFAFAVDSATTNKSQVPQPEAQSAAKEGAGTETSEKGMTGGMVRNRMMDRMHTCMAEHKDGIACDHMTMEECQKNAENKDCQKMMKEIKSKKSIKKNK